MDPNNFSSKNLRRVCYKMIIAYDGTLYAGWQIQKNGLSIQEVIQNSMETILNQKVKIHGSGRTDAKVHAKNQVAHFHIDTVLDLKKFIYSLNALLPLDIRIISVEEVEENFHARYSAKAKIYHYHIRLSKIADPFKFKYSWHMHLPIDLFALREAAVLFIGRHDFTSFTNKAHLDPFQKDNIRYLKRLDVLEEEGGIRLEFEGDGFLYKMVRNITGFLVQVGLGRRRKEEILEILEAKDRTRAAVAAPATGLFLMKVIYDTP